MTQHIALLDLPVEVLRHLFARLSMRFRAMCCRVSKEWKGLLEGQRGDMLVDYGVATLCSVLAEEGVDAVMRRMHLSHPRGIPRDLERMDQVRRFVQRYADRRIESVDEWMQLASQEPETGWLRPVASRMMLEGTRKGLMRQVFGKPQGFGRVLDTLREHSGSVRCVAWARDGSLLASSGGKGIRLWTPDGQEKCIVRGHSKDNPECTCTHDTVYPGSYDAKPECPVKGHDDDVWRLAWNHDGSLLASGGLHGIRLWTKDGQEHKGTLGKNDMDLPVMCLVWNHDGSLLASTGCEDEEVWLWDPTTMEKKTTLRGHSSYVYCVCWNPDGSLLASGSDDETVKLWDTTTMKEFCTLPSEGLGPVNFVAWNHEGSLLASAVGSQFSENTVILWDPKTQEQKRVLRGHTLRVHEVAFSLDDKSLATSSADKTIKLWDLSGETSVEKGIPTGHSPENPDCTCYDGDGELQDDDRCPVVDPRLKGTLRGHSHEVLSVAFSPDNKTLASGSDDKTIKLWDLSGESPAEKGDSRAVVDCVAYSPDKKCLASASCQGLKLWGKLTVTIKLWDLSGETPVEKGTLRGHSEEALDQVCSVAWNHDGSLLASAGGRDNTVTLWDPKALENKGTIKGHTVCPDGHQLKRFTTRKNGWSECSLCGQGVRAGSSMWGCRECDWNACNEQDCRRSVVFPKATLRGHSEDVQCVCWNHDGSLLASGSLDGTVKLWDPTTKEEKRTLTADDLSQEYTGVRSVAISPDSNTLASGYTDGSVRLWDLSGDTPMQTGTVGGHCLENPECTCQHGEEDTEEEYEKDPECPVEGHWKHVTCIKWNHDGSQVATASIDKSVKLWDPTTMEKKGTLLGTVASWQDLDPDTKALAAKVQEGGSDGSNGTCQYIVTAIRDMVYVYQTDSEAGGQGEPLASFHCPDVECFHSPAAINVVVETISCRGTSVVVGCADGQVLIFEAPFLRSLSAMG